MEKVKYEFDPHNRLTVKSDSLRGVRKVLDGQFKISGHNALTYHIKAPVSAGIKAPHQVKLNGVWSLTKDHQLRLTLDKWQRQTFGDQVTLQGELLSARKNSLLFAVATQAKDGMTSTYALELSGVWQAGRDNRLTFRVDKENGRTDSLIFNGAWQVDENYQLIYNYQKARLARKRKEIHNLIFKGHWDIKDKLRLSYVLDADSASRFDFIAGAGIFKGDRIKYEVEIGLGQKRRPVKQTVIFRGGWKIGKNAVAFNLRNNLNRETGAGIEVSREIFRGGGQAFLRLVKSGREAAILAGAGWRW